MDFGLTAAVVRFYAKYKALNDIAGMENILAISLRGYGFYCCICFMYRECLLFFPESDICRKYDGKGSGRDEESVSFTSFNIALTLSTMVFRAVINAHENFLF